MNIFLEKLQRQSESFSNQKTFKIDDYTVREFIATIYRLLESFCVDGSKDLHHLFEEGGLEVKSLAFIGSRPFLRNYLEKTLFWLILEIFHCKSLAQHLKMTLFRQEKVENKKNINDFLLFISRFNEINRVSIEKCHLFQEFDDFLQESPNEELERLKNEWHQISQKLEKVDKNPPMVIISPDPMVLNLSDNSNPSSEENTPKHTKDSFLDENPKKNGEKNKSRRIYREFYQKMNKECHFIGEEQEGRLRDQDHKCWKCKKDISKGFLGLGGNARFCYYFNKWFCQECMSTEKSLIPGKILKDFDFSLWEVSESARRELKSYFTLPIINVPYEKEIVLKHAELYETMILRRQIHLIFESICNSDLIKILLEKRLNLVLRDNLFSLQNLVEIHEGKLKTLISEVIDRAKDHFRQCGECVRKTNSCPNCKDKKPLYFFEIKKTKVCKSCKKVFHFKCYMEKGCQECGMKSLLAQV